jgi:hypothetical protein
MGDESLNAAAPAILPGQGRLVLFSVRNFWFLKYYNSVLRSLAERGHRIHIVADRQDMDTRYPEWMAAVESMSAEYAGITFGWMPPRPKDGWHELRIWLLRLLDYTRFLEPQFDNAPVLRRRAAKHTSPFIQELFERQWPGRRLVAHALERLGLALDRAVSPVAHIEQMLRRHNPDLLLVSPLVTLGSRQGEVVRAARRVGIPSIFAAGSWDHLSSKARIREVPDVVFVWNATQRQEAVQYHGIPDKRVVVTGAQCFDEWFDRQPSRDRATFCRYVGLPEDRPFVLYVCSSLFWGSPLEAAFVEQWVAAVRSSRHESLRSASLLIRPHPKRGAEWSRTNLDRFDNVRVWPPLGEPPLAASAKADYFDSLYYASAIVGLNTSAQIEGALIGRPVFTVLLPEFWDNQEGTLHFHYLLDQAGGPLNAARSIEEHLDQVAAGMADPARASARNRTFVESFVRPRGLAQSSTQAFVEQLERLFAAPRHPVRARIYSLASAGTRLLMLPMAHALRRTPIGDGRSRRVSKSARREAMSDVAGTTVKARRERVESAGEGLETARLARAKEKAARLDKTKTKVKAALRPKTEKVRKPRPSPGSVAVDRQMPPRPRVTALPTWAWTLRAVIQPAAKRIPLGALSDERLWRQARYAQKEAERELRRCQAEGMRAERARARETESARNRVTAARRKSTRSGWGHWRRRVRGRVTGIASRLGIIARPSEPPPPVQPS